MFSRSPFKNTSSVLLLLAALLPAACSPTVDADGPIIVERTSNVTLLQITDQGAGGLTADTPYSQKAIEAALPGFRAEGFQSATRGQDRMGDRRLQLGRLPGAADLQAQQRQGARGPWRHASPRGPQWGAHRHDLFRDRTSRSDCRDGRNLWRGMAICKARGTSNVTLVYAISQYAGPFDRLPPQEELRKAALQRIIWTAP